MPMAPHQCHIETLKRISLRAIEGDSLATVREDWPDKRDKASKTFGT